MKRVGRIRERAISLPDRSERASAPFPWDERLWLIATITYVVLAFILGGSDRPEVASLPLLRGWAVLALGLALVGLPRLRLSGYRLLLLAGIGVLILPLAQLIPLPPGLPATLPGRDLLREIDQLTGLETIWRPMSMTPLHTANAFMAALVPVAALLLAMLTGVRLQERLAISVVTIAAASALIGLAQILDPTGTIPHPYLTTDHGFAVGLFANRSHQAVFMACAIVLLPFAWPKAFLAFSSWPGWNQSSLHAALLLLGCLLLAMMVLLTGSRTGLLAGAMAVMALPLIIRTQWQASKAEGFRTRPRRIAARIAVAALLLSSGLSMAVWLDRAEAVDRLLSSSPATEARPQILATAREATAFYWPWGSGMGSFEKVIQIHEPDALLGLVYMTHAHNDVLEVLLTGGMPAFVLMLCAAALWVVCAFRTFIEDRHDSLQALRKAGLVITLILALASLTDYPLRTPSLACLFAIAAVWAAIPPRPSWLIRFP